MIISYMRVSKVVGSFVRFRKKESSNPDRSKGVETECSNSFAVSPKFVQLTFSIVRSLWGHCLEWFRTMQESYILIIWIILVVIGINVGGVAYVIVRHDCCLDETVIVIATNGTEV